MIIVNLHSFSKPILLIKRLICKLPQKNTADCNPVSFETNPPREQDCFGLFDKREASERCRERKPKKANAYCCFFPLTAIFVCNLLLTRLE